MNYTPIIIFSLTYAGIALGRIPGLNLDRNGIALLGAIAMTATGAVSIDRAVKSIDVPTIVLLYSLMVISAQLRLGGFYTWTAEKIAAILKRPKFFLFVLMSVSAILSALLANDIICIAFTPVLSYSLISAGMNPLPFLLALALSSNAGSAATIIGNPQNMLIGQTGGLHFASFTAWCLPPSAAALFLIYLIICHFYKKDLAALDNISKPPEPEIMNIEHHEIWPEFNLWQSTKGIIAVISTVCLFFTDIPRELTALTVAGILLCSRKMESREILSLIDWNLITLFCALFVVIQGMEDAGLPALLMTKLAETGADLTSLFNLTAVSTILSNIVSNVPASMLLIKFLDKSNPSEWYILAVSSTFAGNLILIGSIANLIVVEQASKFGITVTFREHAKTGIPATIMSILVLVAWAYIIS
ncbi:SLC13 family permease [Desulforegula conservatrix]|uniref:SLC13 family permease n=1 Tax=Desulforegula conservatrix TaxID=153026 RepID=UPI00040B5F2A|nr:SLC13 family permease [Desulforegula conservatrix]